MNLHNKDISDKDLLCECMNGKEWAWEIFYERFALLVSSVVKRAVFRYSSILAAEEVDDCRQVVWTSFIEKDFYILRKWEGKCSLATWLRVCGSHAAAGYLRSLTRHPQETSIDEAPIMSEDTSMHSSGDTFDEISRNEILERIMSIVENKLSRQERLFARLYWFEKLPPDEISRVMNTSLENTHLLRHRAEEKIKRYMNVHDS
ncbi:sigma-70 family RNA polymerase sigma factor [bacterium]|nr:sigma-70 family RNA polymerase sigma factor [bacterium]